MVWVALAFLVACLVGGSWHVFVRTRDVFRRLRELGSGVGDGLAHVDEAAARVAESASRAPGHGDALASSLVRLGRTRAQFGVLTAAIGETAELGRGVRGLVPKK